MRGAPRPVPEEGSRGSVAIVVPCFDHAAHIPSMFESIVRQTRLPDEVVFVVDHSPDDTGAILEGLIATTSPLLRDRCRVLVNERNFGQAASLNRGIETTSSDLILVLNDDDYLMHDVVATQVQLFAAYPEVAIIGAHSIHFATDAELADLPKTIADHAGPSGPSLEVRQPLDVLGYRGYNDLNMTHSGSCFLRVAWRAVGGYASDKRSRIVPFSDRDFQLRLNALFPVGVSPAIPFSFWRSGSSVDHGLNS
jgi:glycosyltransferase involved in cell wall biosynthesis